MKTIKMVIITDNQKSARHLEIPSVIMKFLTLSFCILFCLAGYLTIDYSHMSSMRRRFKNIHAENEGLKGEAALLVENLKEVKRSLRRVQDYSSKLTELTNVQMNRVSRKTGIGPLTASEHQAYREHTKNASETPYIPLGIQLDKLIFKPIFKELEILRHNADSNAFDLQQLLSSLSQKKSLLSSLPSRSPVDGWLASGFGIRVSPFTGRKTMHNGVDLASPIGTPVYAPADGVVIFSGSKAGFGNFVMIAHGNGIVSRYGHNAQNLVEPGQKVQRGDQIATVGMTGRTTGPHLHYEVLVNGRNSDPRKFMLDF